MTNYPIFEDNTVKEKESKITIRYGNTNNPLEWQTKELSFTQSDMNKLSSTNYIEGIPNHQIRKVNFSAKDEDKHKITYIPANFLNNCSNLKDLDFSDLWYVRHVNQNFLINSNVELIRMGFINSYNFIYYQSLFGKIILTGDSSFNNLNATVIEDYKSLPILSTPELPIITITEPGGIPEPNCTRLDCTFNTIDSNLYTHYELKIFKDGIEVENEIVGKDVTYTTSLCKENIYEYTLTGYIGIYPGGMTEKRTLYHINSPILQNKYLDFTGRTQYLNTNYVPTNNTEIEVSFEYNGTAESYWRIMFGTGNISVWGVQGQPQRYGGQYSTPSGSDNIVDNISLNTKHKINLKKENGNANIYFNDILVSSRNDTTNPSTYPFFIGNRNNAGSPVGNQYWEGKIYRFKVWENSVLVMDLYPIEANETIVIESGSFTATSTGFINLLNGDLFYNNGSGSLNIGHKQ